MDGNSFFLRSQKQRSRVLRVEADLRARSFVAARANIRVSKRPVSPFV